MVSPSSGENLCRLRSGLLYCIKLAQSSDDQVRSMIIQALARSIRNGSLATITTRPESPRTFPFSEVSERLVLRKT
jgi:hypothetical protein